MKPNRTAPSLESAFRCAAAEAAAQAFLNVLRNAEAKANFDPNQPRVPRGSTNGGEWTRIASPGVRDTAPSQRPSGRGDASVGFDWSEIEVGFRSASREVQQFLARNRGSVTRVLGALQAFGGAAEVLGGAGAVGAGVATSEAGVGIAIAGAGAWMVANGYDNFSAGWRALLTGHPQNTNLNTLLRQLGLSDEQATATEILLAGGVATGAARLNGEALEQAAQAALAQRAARIFAREQLNVRIGARRIWDEPNIELRGEAWEAFDASRTGFARTPRGFPVFDQYDSMSLTAVSNKTLDLVRPGYSLADRNRVYNTLAIYVDRAAAFQRARGPGFELFATEIRYRRVHVLFPAGEALPGQALQIAAAEQYAAQRGVTLQVEYAR